MDYVDKSGIGTIEGTDETFFERSMELAVRRSSFLAWDNPSKG